MHRSAEAQSQRIVLRAQTPAPSSALLGVGSCVLLRFRYTFTVQVVNLSYRLKLYPTVNKADTLALLSSLFQREHAACTTVLSQEGGRLPSTKGMGEFIGRAYRRAFIDYRRTTKAGHTPGFLKAELIDSAEVQQPRTARGFDLWIMLRGTTTTPGRKGGFYIPAKKHRAINRTLALPGAKLNESAEVFRKNGKWHARVSVAVPLAEVQAPTEWIGCDIGARAAVTRSDGYQGPDLRPILKRQRNRRAMDQKRGIDRRVETSPQRQVLAREARRTVLVAQKSGRGIALEDPKRLIRWKGHAARYFATRVGLLAALVGVSVALIRPAYTSITCSRCGWVEKRQRHKETFRCWRCAFTHNADQNASRNIRHRAYRVTAISHGSLSLSPGGAEADE